MQQLNATLLDAFAVVAGRLTDAGARIHWLYLSSALLLASAVFIVGRRRRRHRSKSLLRYLFPRTIWLHRSALLDVQLLFSNAVVRAGLIAPIALSTLTVIGAVAGVLQLTFGPPTPSELSRFQVALIYTLALFLIDDATRYLLHRLMHRIPWLWEIHSVHHSAEVLTPLTLYRSHPLEIALYTLRATLSIGVVTGVCFYLFRGKLNQLEALGINMLGFFFSLAGANLRHSHVRLSFGRRLERWFISPAQHQLHHSSAPRHHGRNFGSFLAIWDRLGGSLATPELRQRFRFGLGARANHRHRLLSAYIGPCVGAARQLLRLTRSVR